MNKKTIFILLVVLAVLAAVGRSIVVRNFDTSGGSEVMGSPLFKDLPANEIASVVIERPDDTVILTKNESGWIVENRYGYPADFSKLTDLVRKMKETKVGRKFPATEPVKKRLSLIPPDDENAKQLEKAARITVKDKQGTVLADIFVGNTRKREEKGIPDSQFVMLGKGTDVYLVDQIFSSFLAAASSWLKKAPVQVNRDDIQKITCTGPDEKVRYILERPKRGKAFELVDPPVKGALKESAVNRLAGALSGLEIEDVANPATPPDSPAPGVSPRLDYALFNGMTYHAYPGLTCSPGIPCYLRLRVDFKPPAQKTPEKKGDAKEAADEKSNGALMAETAELNARLAPWYFVVPQWQHEAFITNPDELLEKEKNNQ